jgi:hypothetical protein
MIGAPVADPTPGFAGGPHVRPWDVVGLDDGGPPPALPEVVSEPARCDLGGLVQRNLRGTSLQRCEIVCGRQCQPDPSLPVPRASVGCGVAAGDADRVRAQAVAVRIAGDQR